MKYIRIKLTDELHLYSLYEWTIFVCCNFVLRMYFIRIQLMNLVHLYLKNNRSTRTPVTQKRQKMCTSAEIKPSLVTLSPPSNRYLSQPTLYSRVFHIISFMSLSPIYHSLPQLCFYMVSLWLVIIFLCYH